MNVDDPQLATTKAPSSEEASDSKLNRLKGSRVAIESFLERYADSQSERIDALAGVEWLDRIVAEAAMGNFDSSEIERWMVGHRELAESSNLSEPDRKRISFLLLELQSSSDKSTDNQSSDNVEIDGAKELRRRFATWKERSGSVSIGSEIISAESIGSDNVVSASRQVTTGDLPDITPDITMSRTLNTAPHTRLPDSDTPRSMKAPRVEEARAKSATTRRVVLRRKSEKADIGLFEKFTEQVWAELDLLYREFESGEHALTKLDELLKLAESKSNPMYLHLAGSLIYFLKIEGFRMAPYAERLRKAEKRFTSGASGS